MKRIAVISLVSCSLLCVSPQAARADAIVVTKAMEATTIAEVYIEPGEIRVELEIGWGEARAFQSLLPAEFREPSLGDDDSVISDGWAVLDENGEPLDGRVVSAERGWRQVRDEITGEPLAVQPEDADEVVSLVLTYVLDGEPDLLSFRPPMRDERRFAAADVGFVVYDRGIPVNDFRYLGRVETLDLDWEDPWFSRFRNPNLVRRYDAPLSAFLYVEHFEVRQEIVLRPRDLQQWVDLGLKGKSSIAVDEQKGLKQRVVEFLLERNPVVIDGRTAERRLGRINFIRRSLRQTGIVDPPEEMDLDSATLGVILVCPIDELPESVDMTWELFGPKIQKIPVVASDEAGGLPGQVTPENPVLQWKNYLTNPSSPLLASVPPPPSRPSITIPVVSVICGGVLVVLLAFLGRRRATAGRLSRVTLVTATALLLVGLVSWPYLRVRITDPFSTPPSIPDTDARVLLGSLLSNVYRAFDHSDESMIYDRLARSVDGDLLSDVYLETRRSMEVRNQGGLRISVKEVTIQELETLEEDTAQELRLRCRWRVAGWIGHWGHIHSRTNEHVADLTLAPRNNQWKITAIEMLDEQPIEAGNESADPKPAGGA